MDKYNISIGNSGEYFVAAELERRGFTAAVPMSNTKDFDILAINRTTYRQVALQVKTNHSSAKQWTLSKKNEDLIDDNIYYVFVSLNEQDAPEYYIVESKLVAESVRVSHANWLNTPGKYGQPHNDTTMRKFGFGPIRDNVLGLKADDFKSNWDCLK